MSLGLFVFSIKITFSFEHKLIFNTVGALSEFNFFELRRVDGGQLAFDFAVAFFFRQPILTIEQVPVLFLLLLFFERQKIK